MPSSEARTRFIVDANVGKLARWLRMLGYDTVFINNIDDGELVSIALREKRVIVTKDTRIILRRVVASGRVKDVLIEYDDPGDQFRQLARAVKLDQEHKFTRCLECNQPLEPRGRDEVEGLVPPYVFETQSQYHQCPACRRIYWRATHWQHMSQVLDTLLEGSG